MTATSPIEHTVTSSDLVDELDRLAPRTGANVGAWPGLTVYRFTEPTEPQWEEIRALSLGIVARGRKAVTADGRTHVYDPFNYLVISSGRHFECSIVEASVEKPCLCFVLEVEPTLVRSVSAEMVDRSRGRESSLRIDVGDGFVVSAHDGDDFVVSALDDELLSSVLRFVRSLSNGADRRVLAPLYLQEVVYRVLQREQFARMLHLAGRQSSGNPVAAALTYVTSHLDEPLTVSAMAAQVNLSPSAFSRQFRDVTGSSPYQFVKDMRLSRARGNSSWRAASGSPRCRGPSATPALHTSSRSSGRGSARRQGITPTRIRSHAGWGPRADGSARIGHQRGGNASSRAFPIWLASLMRMRAARMYGLNEPLRVEEVDVPDIGPDEVLVKVAATGLCRSDVQLIEGYFTDGAAPDEPIIPGHEVAGRIADVGAGVPAAAGLSEGDLVVVNPNWGDGTCRQCREGNEQICANGQMAGFGPPGGFAEYMPVPHRHVIKVPDGLDPKPETLAPLTDAGLTPYRGMKKLVRAGKVGAGRTVVVNGIGGLGSYGVQYARLLSGGATVVAFARSDEKLSLAKENGAHHTVNTRDKSAEQVQDELEQLTGRRDVDGWLDCAAAEESLTLGATILAKEGAMSSVGLMGQKIVLPLLPFTNGEKSFHGSFWGNYDDLAEVLDLAAQGLIKHAVTRVGLDDVNANLDALARGDMVGRAVITFD